MTDNNKSTVAEILEAIGFAAVSGAVVYALIAFIVVRMCSMDDDGCQTKVGNWAILLSALWVVFMLYVFLKPIYDRRRAESHAISVENHRRTSKAFDEQERDRIDRDYSEGLNSAEVGRVRGMNEAEVKRENARTDAFVMLTSALADGKLAPDNYANAARALLGTNGNHARLGGATQIEAITPPREVNHWEYRIMSVGGLDSPVVGGSMKSGYLTCSLKALEIAGRIAENGKQPSRAVFEAYGIKAAVEAQACQLFLKDRGLLDPAFDQYRWHPRLDAAKLSKWITGTIADVNRRGGEAVYREAARKALGLPEPANAASELDWHAPNENVVDAIQAAE